MAWLIGIIVGGIIGLIYGMGISADRRFYALINFIIGAIGGLVGIWFFFLVLGIASSSTTVNFWLGVAWSVIGSVVLMAIADGIAAIANRGRREHREYREGYPVTHEYEEKEYTRKRRK